MAVETWYFFFFNYFVHLFKLVYKHIGYLTISPIDVIGWTECWLKQAMLPPLF